MANKKEPELIDGRKVASIVKESIKKEVADLIDNHDRSPHLVAVLVGSDPASETYVGSKEKQAREVGMMSSVYRFPDTITEAELLETVDFLNNDDEVDGFIVQLPLPSHINEEKVINAIDPKKDVDGFTPISLGNMVLGKPGFVSATPMGVMELLHAYQIDLEGKHCVVLGRSNIVGRPLSILLSQKNEGSNATVTLCHSRTENLADITRQADVLICAIGQPLFVKADMVKEGAVIIDVGMHRLPDATAKRGYRLAGDVDFKEVFKKASYITPVPGGVGPMTIAMLLKNTLQAHRNRYNQ